MIRVTVPHPVAEALMDGSLRLLVVEGEIEFEPWRHCTTDCEATGRCPVCERLYPPAGRSMPFEAHRSYCEPECDGWDDDRCRSKHLWPGELARLDRQAPADLVRAIKAGERIGINATCEMCGGKGALWYGMGAKCPHCADGREPVGSVRPVRVLPVVGYMRGRVPDAPCIEVVTASYVREWYECPPDATHDRIMHRMVDLSVYGPAESLVGKFAVEVEDARRGP